MDARFNIHCFYGRRSAIIWTVLVLLLVLTITPRLADASPYNAGYSHGCDDGKLGFHKYLNTPERELITTLRNLCKGMIMDTKLALVQTALAGVVVIIKFIPNLIQEVHLYRVINHSTLQSIVMDIVQEQ
jgi:hypothetical protein